jgi:hypothetical protein
MCNKEITYKEKINKNNAELGNRKCRQCSQTKKYKICIICNTEFRGQGLGCSKPCTAEVSKITKLRLYNDPYYNNRTKSKSTCLEKYGVDSVSQVPEVKAKKKLHGTTFPNGHAGKNNGMFGKKHSEETKRILRVKRLNALNNNKKCYPSYNPKGCLAIEEYGKLYGYNFQHALNGGEYHIEYLGYYVDGYDKEKNVVIEYDEQYHFKNGALRSRDIKRQEEIMRYLNCTFIRIKE